MLLRNVGGALILLLFMVFEKEVTFFALKLQSYYSSLLLYSIYSVSSNPFGWKLEPRLANALESFLRYYIEYWATFGWPILISKSLHLVLIYGGAFCLLLFGNVEALMLSLCLISLLFIAPVVVLFFLGSSQLLYFNSFYTFLVNRLLFIMLQIMFSLGNLFRGKYYSVLRLR